MKFCLYTSTPGLERFSKLERFRVWETTHKRLMREDAEYCRKVRRTTWKQIWAAVVFTILLCVLILSGIKGRWGITTNACLIGVLTIGYAVYNTVASFRLQEFMNEKVGNALQ